MIRRFVERFEAGKDTLRESLSKEHPSDYEALVKLLVETITSDDYDDIDPERIREINDGDYQGTLVYVIGAKGYQPSTYYYTRVNYGSCSGCDTLQAIRDYDSDEFPNEQQIEEYLTLVLHLLQNLKQMYDT